MPGQDHFNALELANASIPDQLRHAMILRDRPILGAGLKHLLMFADRLRQHSALVNGESRFFALHVLAGLNGHETHDRVPVVRRGDHDGVDVLPREHFAKVLRAEAILVAVAIRDRLPGAKQVAVVNVTNRNDLGVLVSEVRSEIPAHSVVTGADEADGDAIAGRGMAVGSQYR